MGQLFKMFLEEHTYNHLKERGTQYPYSLHHRFAVLKCQITKSQAFETNYYGHPEIMGNSSEIIYFET